MELDIRNLSDEYAVRRLTPEDVPAIFALSAGNTLFYEYHPPFVTEESILDDMTALPPETPADRKYYVGFFRDGELIAVLDLILGYPDDATAFIGLFMTAVSTQGQGIGSRILTRCLDFLRACGYSRVRLGVDRGNPQSFHFWTKNGFSVDPTAQSPYLVMTKSLT